MAKKINYKKASKILGVKGILILVLLVVLIVIGCYFILPWQVPTASYQNLNVSDEAVSVEIYVDTCVLEDNTSVYVLSDDYKSDKQQVVAHDQFVYMVFDNLPKGEYELIVLFTSITEAEYEILSVKFEITVGVLYEDLEIHFLELGNKYTGDCMYIKAGNTDILVDAGSRGSSAESISEYIDDYVTDGKLEYVIATHADQDHIAGFVGTSSVEGIFERYDVDTIIDFPLTNKETTTYENYVTMRDLEIELGATHYTADQCFNEEDGASRVITLATGITLTFLDNYYYYNESSDENNYSVCFMIEKNNKNFLFTGDLEEDGEEYLVELNDLEEVYLFKAGHHGSATSSNDCLLEVIQPEVVVVTCVAGSDEYSSYNYGSFPTQTFINRISKYTDLVYVTTRATSDYSGYESLNGNICISYKDSIEVNCSNNNTILKDSDWFNEEIYVDSDGKIKDSDDYYNSQSQDVVLTTRRYWTT